MSLTMPQNTDRIRRLCVIVEGRASTYADEVEAALNRGQLRQREAELLDEFEQYTAKILDRLASRQWPKVHDLVFRDLYMQAPDPVDSERRRMLLVALLAAEVEFNAPLKLTQVQNKELAEILEMLGHSCVAEELYLHAAEAFERAAELHLLTSDGLARDRALYRQNMARQRIEPALYRRCVQWMSWVTCGYGYKPYRLLWWVLAQIVVFGVLILLSAPADTFDNVVLVLTNYLNPAGNGDTKDLGYTARVLLTAEAYAGALSVNVFFALLVRRWFR
ncbi:hypothetical protein D5S17_17620 [Pseudonocardiaceae bacterium YIM PH 21723]|nr:hypothetical protein D5S17_17620 [Pseudonocardiaceae bacterium YIM PH 21723]